MNRNAQPAAPQVELRPIICAGTFLVLTSREVQVHMLEPSALEAYWEGWTIADTRTRRDESMLYLVRQTFGRDAEQALPAPSVESLFFYVEHYEGRHQDGVRRTAALILTGKLSDGNDEIDGGAHDRVPTPQPLPIAPAPAALAGVSA